MNDLHLKQRIFEGFVIVFLIAALSAFIYIVSTHKTAEPYCQQFANTAARDLPAQCIRYWQ